MVLKLFKRKKEFALFIARRGGRKWLGKIEASDLKEALSKAYKRLEELSENDPDVTRYRTIIITDMETGAEERFPNPFFEDTGEESQESTGRGGSRKSEFDALMEAGMARMFASMVNAFGEMMKTGSSAMASIMAEAMKTPLTMMAEMNRQMMQTVIEQIRQQLALQQQQGGSEFIEAAKMFLSLVLNWDKVKKNASEILKELNTLAPEVGSKKEEVEKGGGGGEEGSK